MNLHTVFIIYNSDGAIMRRKSVETALFARQKAPPGQFILEGHADPGSQYVDVATKEIRQKQAPTISQNATTVAADGSSLVTFTGLLPNTIARAFLDRELQSEMTVPETVLDISFDTPGKYEIRFTHPRHLTGSFSVVAA